MKKMMALIRNKLNTQKNIFFDGDKNRVRNKIIGVIFLACLFIISMEVYVSYSLDMFKLTNNQYIVPILLLAVELLVLCIMSIIKVINTFYLSSDWREMRIYPLKNGIYLLAKFVLIIMENISIVVFFTIPLVTCGILINSPAKYYLELVLNQVILLVVPTSCIVIISITILAVIIKIRTMRIKIMKFISLIFFDIIIGISTYIIFTNINDIIKKVIFGIVAIGVSLILLYFICGDIYFDIMMSEIFFNKVSKDKNVRKSNYQRMNFIKSNVLRDMKLIIRTPALRANYIVMSIGFNIVIFGVMISVVGSLRSFGIVNNALYIGITVWILSIVNLTASTSFSREGLGLKMIKIFPVKNEQYIISKIYVALLSYIFEFILFSIYILLVSNSIVEGLLLEISLVSYIAIIIISGIKCDCYDLSLRWTDIKELFELDKVIKVIKPVNIFCSLCVVYGLIVNFVIKQPSNELIGYVEVLLIVLVNIIVSYSGFKKIKLVYAKVME